MLKTKTIYEFLAPFYDLDDVMCVGAKQHWRKKIVKELDIKGKLALDLATGTGRTAKILSKRMKSQVIGVDFSKNMLKIARIRNLGRNNVIFILCDAVHLPFKDETFDAITCTCGMDTVDAPEAVFSEAVRVLKNKGKIGMMYFTEPKGWIRYLDPIIKKYYNTIWNAGNVDVIPLVFEHGLKILRRYRLGLGIAEAIIVEKA